MLAIVAMLLGFLRNYLKSEPPLLRFTLFYLCIFNPNIADVVQYRILDTFVGAILSFCSYYFIWPSEFLNVPTYLSKPLAPIEII
jgi:uncharacterized membrane protein YccC